MSSSCPFVLSSYFYAKQQYIQKYFWNVISSPRKKRRFKLGQTECTLKPASFHSSAVQWQQPTVHSYTSNSTFKQTNAPCKQYACFQAYVLLKIHISTYTVHIIYILYMYIYVASIAKFTTRLRHHHHVLTAHLYGPVC